MGGGGGGGQRLNTTFSQSLYNSFSHNKVLICCSLLSGMQVQDGYIAANLKVHPANLMPHQMGGAPPSPSLSIVSIAVSRVESTA